MTTKQQERDALAKIRKIVEGLGENSYIGTAFEGCFEDAEFNIDSDAAFSLKGRLELEQAEHAKTKQRLNEVAQEAASAVAVKAEALDRLEGSLARERDSREKFEAVQAERDGYFQQLHDSGEREDALELEIVHLKAKLYDQMTAGA